MSTQSYLKIIPDFSNKKLVYSGSVSVREKVSVTVKDCGDVCANLVLRIVSNDGTDLAKFPLATGDAWTQSGDDAVCTIDLNTDEMVAAFDGMTVRDSQTLAIIVENNSAANQYASGNVRVSNWIPDSSVNPTKVGDLSTVLDAIKTGISSVTDGLSALVSKFTAHAHTGSDGSPKVSHTNLSGVEEGTLTHSKGEGGIDYAISNIDRVLTGHLNGKNPHGITPDSIGAATASDLSGEITRAKAAESANSTAAATAAANAATAAANAASAAATAASAVAKASAASATASDALTAAGNADDAATTAAAAASEAQKTADFALQTANRRVPVYDFSTLPSFVAASGNDDDAYAFLEKLSKILKGE